MLEITVLYKFIAIISSLLVVTVSNPVHSVLFLVLVFCSTAAFLFTMGVEFLAIIFVVVYVGAIAVLFLFVCMMLNIKMEEMQQSVLTYLPIGAFFVLLFFIELLSVFLSGPAIKSVNIYIDWFSLYFQAENIQALGLVLYTFNFFAFILGGLVLLVAMIGAIQLTLYHRLDVKRQYIYQQIKKKGFIFR